MAHVKKKEEEALIEYDSPNEIGKRVSIRSIVLGVTILAFFAYIFPMSVPFYIRPFLDLGWTVPSPAAMFFVFVLMVLNPILNKFKKGLSFSQGEMITVYGMILAGGVIISAGFFSYWVYGLMAYQRVAYLEGQPEYAVFLEGVMPYIAPVSLEATIGFWLGESSVPWSEWVIPILVWALFITVFAFTLLCLVTMVRRHWTERERLQYPLAQVILKMTGSDKDLEEPFWMNKTMWIGFGVVAIISSLNALNQYFSAIPIIPLAFDPWRTMGDGPLKDILGIYPHFRVRLDPMLVGIGYLISAQLTFSLWFFYLLQWFVVYPIIYYSTGSLAGETNLMISQNLGSMGGIALISLWLARREVVGIIRRVFMKSFDEEIDDSREPLSYGTAVYGLVLGIVFFVVFCSIFMSAPPIAALAYILIFLLLVLSLARIRAEQGLPQQAPFTNDFIAPLVSPVGISRWGENSTVFFLRMYPFTYGFFGSLGAIGMEQFKMAEGSGIRNRSMTKVILIAVAASVVLAFAFGLPAIYNLGAYSAHNHFRRATVARQIFHLHTYTNMYQSPNIMSLVRTGAGFGGVLLLSYLHTHFIWWPLHPIGFALSTFHDTYIYWAPFLIAWILKTLVLRYGGQQFVKKTMPAAIGIIAASIVMNIFWALVSLIFM